MKFDEFFFRPKFKIHGKYLTKSKKKNNSQFHGQLEFAQYNQFDGG